MGASRFASIRVAVDGEEAAERVAAEAWAGGCTGLEERGAPVNEILLYAPWDAAGRLHLALLGAAPPGCRIGAPESVEEVDWSSRWRRGLEPVVVSPRLVVCPPFAPPPPRPGQRRVEIEPGQAFGTGGHASTRLALELVDALGDELDGVPLLDVGAGSGVLALAALRLGAARAVAIDLDPLAVEATRDNARRNGLAERVLGFVGGLEALAPLRFPVVVANLIRSQLEPLLPDLAARLAPGGALALSGLLASERERMAAALARAGLRSVHARERDDPTGDRWLALLTRPAGSDASPPGDG